MPTTMTPTKNAIAMTAASTRVLSLIGFAGWYGWRSGSHWAPFHAFRALYGVGRPCGRPKGQSRRFALHYPYVQVTPYDTRKQEYFRMCLTRRPYGLIYPYE
mgnify:CR=1 FL=1